jgi:hypothetical protein
MKENDVIWVSIEESDKYELSNFGLKKMNLLIKIDMLQLNKLVFIIEILISYCLQALLGNVLNF